MREHAFATAVLLFFVLFCLVFDADRFFGMDSCYEGFFADISENYVRSCENSIRETCGTKNGLDEACVQHMNTHTPLNIVIGRAFFVIDISMLLVVAVRFNKMAAAIAAIAIFANFAFFVVTQIFYAETFFASLMRPVLALIIIAFYAYYFAFLIRERFVKRGAE